MTSSDVQLYIPVLAQEFKNQHLSPDMGLVISEIWALYRRSTRLTKTDIHNLVRGLCPTFNLDPLEAGMPVIPATTPSKVITLILQPGSPLGSRPELQIELRSILGSFIAAGNTVTSQAIVSKLRDRMISKYGPTSGTFSTLLIYGTLKETMRAQGWKESTSNEVITFSPPKPVSIPSVSKTKKVPPPPTKASLVTPPPAVEKPNYIHSTPLSPASVSDFV
jgi:hypothetical protein